MASSGFEESTKFLSIFLLQFSIETSVERSDSSKANDKSIYDSIVRSNNLNFLMTFKK